LCAAIVRAYKAGWPTDAADRGGLPVSIEWIVFGLVVAIGLVAVFGFVLVKTVRDAHRSYDSDQWHPSAFLDVTTTRSASGRS
jgi:hypothetical protein